MNLKHLRLEIEQRLTSGESKTAVFHDVQRQGLPERTAATWIAAYAAPELCRRYAGIKNTMVALAVVELLFGFVLAAVLGLELGASWGLFAAVLAGMVGGGFVWGVVRNRLWAYNTAIVMTLCNLPRTVLDLLRQPSEAAIALAIGLPLLAFTWYVRNRLFPDVGFLGPRRQNGRYVFAN